MESTNLLRSAVAIAVLVHCAGCDQHFSFEVDNNTNAEIADVTVTFGGHGGNWPIGGVGAGGGKSVSMLPGGVPDSADIRWADGAGTVRSQHIQITPLPPPTNTSYGGGGDRDIFFVITPDGHAKVEYHNPAFTQ